MAGEKRQTLAAPVSVQLSTNKWTHLLNCKNNTIILLEGTGSWPLMSVFAIRLNEKCANTKIAETYKHRKTCKLR